MTRFLLDTNIISDLFRNPGGRVDNALRERQNAEIGTRLIVMGELLYGLKKNQNLRGLQRLEMFARSIAVWALEPPVATIYGEIRNACDRMGKASDRICGSPPTLSPWTRPWSRTTELSSTSRL